MAIGLPAERIWPACVLVQGHQLAWLPISPPPLAWSLVRGSRVLGLQHLQEPLWAWLLRDPRVISQDGLGALQVSPALKYGNQGEPLQGLAKPTRVTPWGGLPLSCSLIMRSRWGAQLCHLLCTSASLDPTSEPQLPWYTPHDPALLTGIPRGLSSPRQR